MQIKKGIYLFFYHLRAFFDLTFKPLFALITLGLILSIVLMQSLATQVAGYQLFIGCALTAVWITAIRVFYPTILHWSDTRKDNSAVVAFHRRTKG